MLKPTFSLLAAGALLVLLPATASADSLTVTGTSKLGKRQVALTGSKLAISGTVESFTSGDTVKLAVRRGRKGERTLTKPLTAGEGGEGTYTSNLRVRKAGHYTVVAKSGEKRSTLEFDAFRANSGGRLATSFLQRGLSRLGYAVPLSGRMDDGTRRALMAYRKNNGMARGFGRNGAIVRRVAAGKGGFRVRFKNHGKHVEADLSKQVLALINRGGKVYKIFHTSSGTSATPTVRGSFRFYRKQPGTNAKGMVHSNYFIRGYAIHGYKSVPASPASHGCLRVPIPNAMFINRWIRLGDRIDVYA